MNITKQDMKDAYRLTRVVSIEKGDFIEMEFVKGKTVVSDNVHCKRWFDELALESKKISLQDCIDRAENIIPKDRRKNTREEWVKIMGSFMYECIKKQ